MYKYTKVYKHGDLYDVPMTADEIKEYFQDLPDPEAAINWLHKTGEYNLTFVLIIATEIKE